jgi:hypothetical protein
MIDVTPPPDRTPPGLRGRATADSRRSAADAAPASPAERVSLWIQLGLAVTLEAAFLLAGWTLYKSLPHLPIAPWQKVAFQLGLGLAFLVFGLRARRLWGRLRKSAPRKVEGEREGGAE